MLVHISVIPHTALTGCLYGGKRARVPGLARLAEIHRRNVIYTNSNLAFICKLAWPA